MTGIVTALWLAGLVPAFRKVAEAVAGTMNPKASAAVQPHSQFWFGASAPRYMAVVKKPSFGAPATLVRASLAGRGSREVTGSMFLPPRTTSGPRVIEAIGASAGSDPAISTLLLPASNTPRAVASV